MQACLNLTNAVSRDHCLSALLNPDSYLSTYALAVAGLAAICYLCRNLI